MTDEEKTVLKDEILIFQPPDTSAFEASIRRLAERLGVEPGNDGYDIYLYAEGKNYSIMKLAHAFLDRMQATEAPYSPGSSESHPSSGHIGNEAPGVLPDTQKGHSECNSDRKA